MEIQPARPKLNARGAAFYLRFLELEGLPSVIPDDGGVGYFELGSASEHGGVGGRAGEAMSLTSNSR